MNDDNIKQLIRKAFEPMLDELVELLAWLFPHIGPIAVYVSDPVQLPDRKLFSSIGTFPILFLQFTKGIWYGR